MKTPLSVFVAARIALLPTRKNALQALALLASTIIDPIPVVRLVPIWKIHCAFGSLLASRVSVPAKTAVVANL